MNNENIHIYVAGPLHSSGRATENVHKAIELGHILREMGVIPFVPHLFAYWDNVFPAPAKFWLEMDKAWLMKCDAIIILPGESRGVDQEREWAKEIGMPIFEGESALECCKEWVASVKEQGLTKPHTEKPAELTLSLLQDQLAPWVGHNFGDRPSWHPLLGMGEELGELHHAHLKSEQGIRGTEEEHHAKKIDALGDLLIFMADYASAEGIDLQKTLEETWAQVRKRDWKKDKVSGGEKPEPKPTEEILADEMSKRGALTIPKHKPDPAPAPQRDKWYDENDVKYVVGQDVRSLSGKGGSGIGFVTDVRIKDGSPEYHCVFGPFKTWLPEHDIDPVTGNLFVESSRDGVKMLKALGPRLVDVVMNGRYRLLSNSYRPEKSVQVRSIYTLDKIVVIDLEDEETTYTISPVELGPMKKGEDEEAEGEGGSGSPVGV